MLDPHSVDILRVNPRKAVDFSTKIISFHKPTTISQTFRVLGKSKTLQWRFLTGKWIS
jgi:hypothetical protein